MTNIYLPIEVVKHEGWSFIGEECYATMEDAQEAISAYKIMLEKEYGLESPDVWYEIKRLEVK